MALFSLSKSRNSAFKSADSIDKRLSNTNKVARNIGTTLRNQTVFKKQSIAKRQNIYQKRLDGIRRKDQKDLFEASRSTGAIQRVGRVTTGSTKGFLGRILDSISTLLVGWTIINLPKIITLADTLGKRIGSMTGILSSFMNSTFAILQEFGTVTSALIRSLSAFDFSDMGKQIDSSMARVKNAFSQMEIDFFTALTMLTEPIDFEIDEGKQDETRPPGLPPSREEPPSGKAGDYGSPGEGAVKRYAASKGYSAAFTAGLLSTISNESTFNPYAIGDGGASYGLFQFQGSRRPPFLNYLAANGIPNPMALFQNPNGPSAKKYRNQVFGLTLQYMMENEQGAQLVRDYRNSDDLATIMGGFEDIEGYQGSQPRLPRNKRNNAKYRDRLKEAQAYLKAGVDAPTGTPTPVPAPPSAQRPLQKGDIFTKSLGRGVEYIQIGDLYGSRGGAHGGIDIQTPQGTYIALRTPCEVVAQGEYGNYGLLIDVWLPEYGVQLRMAHLSSVLIKSGNIPAGTSFARVGSSGNATGPHIHLEYAKRKGQFSGNAGNPEPYVRLLLLTDKPNRAAFTTPPKPVATPAEISGVPRQQAAAESVTPERQGKTLVVAAPAQLYQNPAMMVGSSGGSQIIISGQGLNNLIKQRMLMELAYT